MKNRIRRHSLKALALAAPAIWVKPIVNSAVLPVHAAISGLEGLECTQPGSIFVESNEGPACGETVGSGQDLEALFALNPEAPDVPMAGVVLCNGEAIDINFFSSDQGLGTNLNPAELGCTSGTIAIRLYRLDTECFAECSWTVSDPS